MPYDRARRRWCTGVKQGAPANNSPQWPAPWGPHCFLHQERHDKPFNKREVGHMRRMERKFTAMTRRHIPDQRSYDDGWFAPEH